jgi:Cysteine-rich secretory protein family
MRPFAKMLVLAALLAVFGSVAGNVAAGGGGPQARVARSQPAGYEAVLLREINQVRTGRGLPELRPSGRLATAAAHHSKRMAERGFFDHNSPNGSPFWKRVARFYSSRGFNQWSVGENLAYGSPSLSAEGTVRAWMGSPGLARDRPCGGAHRVGARGLRRPQDDDRHRGLRHPPLTEPRKSRDFPRVVAVQPATLRAGLRL